MRFGDRTRQRRGASACELALLAPLLAFILLVCVDFCRVFFAYTTITNAARNGALWASDPLAASQSPYTTLLAAVQADATNLNPTLTSSNVTAATGTDGQGNATAGVVVTYQFNLVSHYLGFSSINLSRQVMMRVAPSAPN